MAIGVGINGSGAKGKDAHAVLRNKVIFESSKGQITQKDIEAALVHAGLAKGDIVMVHADLQVFGKIGEIKNRKDFLDAILNAFLAVLGPEGTLVVPTFTYSFCEHEVFDVKRSASKVGLFTEHVRNDPRAMRSIHPIFSCAAIGPSAEFLLANLSKHSFGHGSFFERFFKAKGKLMLFGRPFDVTFLHYIEFNHGVNYRFEKKFSGRIIDEEGFEFGDTYEYFVRYLDRDVEYRMENLGDELSKRGLMKRVELGDSAILLCKATDAYAVGFEMLDKDPYAFLKHPPIMPTGKKRRHGDEGDDNDEGVEKDEEEE